MRNEQMLQRFFKFNKIFLATANIKKKTVEIFDGDQTMVFTYETYFQFIAKAFDLIPDFINKAVDGEDIIMKSDGSSTRSYCYVGDASVGILRVLTDGQIGNAYNISNNDNIISIRNLAQVICDNAHVNLDIQIPKSDLDKKIDSNVKTICLDSEKLESLGWEAKTNVEDGIKLTLKVLRRK